MSDDTPTATRMGSEIALRMSQGVESCEILISFHEEMIRFFMKISENAQMFNDKVEKLLANHQELHKFEMNGFLRCFVTFRNFFNVWSMAAERMANSLQVRSVTLMESRLGSLQRQMDKFLSVNQQSNASTSASHFSSSKFSSEPNESAMVPPSGANFSVAKGNNLAMVDKWELVRLESLKTMMRSSHDCFLEFQGETESWCCELKHNLKSFKVTKDIEKYVDRLSANDKTMSYLTLNKTGASPNAYILGKDPNSGKASDAQFDRVSYMKQPLQGGPLSSFQSDHDVGARRSDSMGTYEKGQLGQMVKQQGGEHGESPDQDGLSFLRETAVLTKKPSMGRKESLTWRREKTLSSFDDTIVNSLSLKAKDNFDDELMVLQEKAKAKEQMGLFNCFSSLVSTYDKDPILIWMEIQERFETHLMSLKDSPVEPQSNRISWVDPLFYNTVMIENKQAYPYKIPLGVQSDVFFQHNWMALEWGTRNINEFQWGCIAYESLLLVSDYFYDKILNSPESHVSIPSLNNVFLEDQQGAFYYDGEYEVKKNAEEQSVLLHYTMAKSHFNSVLELLSLMRLKLGLKKELNSLLLQLTLRSKTFNTLGYSTNFHPLDVRYRVVRLLDSWNKRKFNELPLVGDEIQQHFKDWISRQLHLLYVAFAFKFWRLIRHTSGNSGLYLWLNTPLAEKKKKCYFREEYFEIFKSARQNNSDITIPLIHLIKCFEQSFNILHELQKTVEKGLWGEEPDQKVSDDRCSSSLFFKLIQLMNSIARLDQQLRWSILHKKSQYRERLHNVEVMRKKAYTKSEAHFLLMQQAKSSTKNPSHNQGSDILELPEVDYPTMPLGPYWRYEAPVIQVIMSYLWRSVTDRSQATVLHPDSSRLWLTLLVVSRVIESGDGTHPLKDNEVSEQLTFASLSLHAHCLLLVNAMWDEITHNTARKLRDNTVTDFSKDQGEKKKVQVRLSADVLKRVLEFCRVKRFFFSISKDMSLLAEKSKQDDQRAEEFPLFPSLSTTVYPNKRDVTLEMCYDLFLHTFYSPLYALSFVVQKTSGLNIAESIDFHVISVTEFRFTEESFHASEIWEALGQLFYLVEKYGENPNNLGENANPARRQWRTSKIQSKIKRVVNILFQSKLPPRILVEEGILKKQSTEPMVSYLPNAIAVLRRRCFEAKRKEVSDGMEWSDPLYKDYSASSRKFLEAFPYQSLANNRSDLPSLENESSASFKTFKLLSLVLPSRVERVMMEVLYSRLLSSSLRFHLIDLLGDYHQSVDPDALKVLIRIWSDINSYLLEIAEKQQGKTSSPTQESSNETEQILRSENEFYYYVIYRSVSRLISATFRKTKTSLMTDSSSQSVSQKKKSPADLLDVFGQVLTYLLEEIRGEFLFYTSSWSSFLSHNEHAGIVIFAVCQILPIYLNELVQSSVWKRDCLSARGSHIISCIGSFDRLFTDVCDVLHNPFHWSTLLFDPFRELSRIFFNKFFVEMESIISRCLDKKQWKPVSGELYSMTVLDFFTFAHQFVSMFFESDFPSNWIIEEFSNYFSMLVSAFLNANAKVVTESFFLQFINSIETSFTYVLAPTSDISFHETNNASVSLNDINPVQKSAKKKTKLISAVKNLSLSKISKSKKKKLEDSLQKQWDCMAGSNTEVSGSADLEGNVDLLHEGGYSTTQETGQKKVNYTGKLRMRMPHEWNDPLKSFPRKKLVVLKGRISSDIAIKYLTVRRIFEKVSLRTCLCRFHNLKRFKEQLILLHRTCCDALDKKLNCRDPQHVALCSALTSVRSNGKDIGDLKNLFKLNPEPVSLRDSFVDSLRSVHQKYLEMTEEALNTIHRCVAFRILLCEFGENFFEELYSSEFSSFPLSHILNTWDETVEQFIQKLPEEFRFNFRQVLLECTLKLWCYIISCIGFHGKSFSPENLAVIKQDMQYLSTSFKKSHKETPSVRQSITSATSLPLDEEDSSTQYPFTLLHNTQQFIHWLERNPSAFAQAGSVTDQQKTQGGQHDKIKSAQDTPTSENINLSLSQHEGVSLDRKVSFSPSTSLSKPKKASSKKKKPAWRRYFL